MRLRFKLWLWQFLLALDQLAYVWLAGWSYVWLGRRNCPNADETISSKVGRQAMLGRRWALICEVPINAVFALLGDYDHCRRSIEWDELSAEQRLRLGKGNDDED